jgi:hypothetical protein
VSPPERRRPVPKGRPVATSTLAKRSYGNFTSKATVETAARARAVARLLNHIAGARCVLDDALLGSLSRLARSAAFWAAVAEREAP